MLETIPGYDKWKTTPPDDLIDDDAMADGILANALYCPFCGCDGHDFDEDGTRITRMFRIRCGDCGARGAWAPDLEMAVGRWNQRKPHRLYPEGKE